MFVWKGFSFRANPKGDFSLLVPTKTLNDLVMSKNIVQNADENAGMLAPPKNKKEIYIYI